MTNYILEVYSDGLIIPITGRAIVEENNAVTLEFGIDDYFNNPDWMTTNIYKIENKPAKRNRSTIENNKIDAFLSDAKREILTYLGRNGLLPLQ